MTAGFTRRDLPADIEVFAGDFASQPLVFAHLLDCAPGLDLDHVVVIQRNHATRLAAHFEAATVAHLAAHPTLVLVLPAAHPGRACPLQATARLAHLGTLRGRVPHLGRTP